MGGKTLSFVTYGLEFLNGFYIKVVFVLVKISHHNKVTIPKLTVTVHNELYANVHIYVSCAGESL